MNDRRHIFVNSLAAISFILLSATVALWVSSYDGVPLPMRWRSISPQVMSFDGGICFASTQPATLMPGATASTVPSTVTYRAPGLERMLAVTPVLDCNGVEAWHTLGFSEHRGYLIAAEEFLQGSSSNTWTPYRLWRVPYWALTILFAAGAALTIPREVRLRLRLRRGLCARCGYDLRAAASDRCPECGAQMKSAAPSAPRRTRRLLPGVCALLFVAICAYGLGRRRPEVMDA